jgi:hypothetical protein
MATALLLPAQIALKQSGFRATALKCASAAQDSQQDAPAQQQASLAASQRAREIPTLLCARPIYIPK